MKFWDCEWGGMVRVFEAEARSKARYKAFKVLREYWDCPCITEIRVTVSVGQVDCTP